MNSRDFGQDLLFGVMALKMDLISEDDFFQAYHAWKGDPERAIPLVLREQHRLSPDESELVHAVSQIQRDRFDDNPRAALAQLSVAAGVMQLLDAEMEAFAEATISLQETSQEDHVDATMSMDDPGRFVADTALPSGQPRFKILRPHARGGLGEVFVARDNEVRRDVALKQIQDRFADQSENRTRFVREAEVTGSLEHPGVVPIYGLGYHDNGRPYYAMRFISGESLAESIKAFHAERESGRLFRSLEFRSLLQRFVAVCNAIEYAHNRKVLHRDLKPANIMLGPFGETLVVDWGLAKLIDDAEAESADAKSDSSSGKASTTIEGQVVGTPAYMSPEQARGVQHDLGTESDIYGLGATLYALLTGQAPFSGDAQDVLAKVRQGSPVSVRTHDSQIPRPLAAVCSKAMEHEPSDRYTSASALAKDLEAWLADEPVSAFPEPVALRARRWMRNHPRFTGGLSTALVMGLLSLSVGLAVVSGLNRQLETANANERRMRERAETNFNLAKDAVDNYLNQITTAPELLSVNLLAIRKGLLSTAIPFYEALTRQDVDDPNLGLTQALAFGGWGRFNMKRVTPMRRLVIINRFVNGPRNWSIPIHRTKSIAPRWQPATITRAC